MSLPDNTDFNSPSQLEQRIRRAVAIADHLLETYRTLFALIGAEVVDEDREVMFRAASLFADSRQRRLAQL